MSYSLNKVVQISFADACEKITAMLKKEGFSIMTEIDVTATLKRKLGLNFKNYKILGACIPHFAYRALTVEPSIGVLLPCNVVVFELDDGQTEVAAIDPGAMMTLINNPAMKDVEAEIQSKLENVINGM